MLGGATAERTVFVAEVHVCAGLAQHLGDLHVPDGGREVQRAAEVRRLQSAGDHLSSARKGCRGLQVTPEHCLCRSAKRVTSAGRC